MLGSLFRGILIVFLLLISAGCALRVPRVPLEATAIDYPEVWTLPSLGFAEQTIHYPFPPKAVAARFALSRGAKQGPDN